MVIVYIVNALIGALIGFITNYLAIKMLFKPLKPVYIGKFRLPFTPGVIPKEKARLAESIGKTVGSKLLTGDVLERAFDDEDITLALDKLIDETVAGMEKSESSIRDVLASVTGDQNRIGDLLCDAAGRYLKSAARSEDFRSVLSGFINSKIAEFMAIPLKHFEEDRHFSEWVDKGIAMLVDRINREGFIDKLALQAADFIEKGPDNAKPLSNYLPDRFFSAIKNAVSNNADKIGGLVTGLLDNPQIEKNIMEILDGLMGSTIATRMINVFVTKEAVYRRIKQKTDKYLKSEKGRQALTRVVNQQVDILKDKSAAEVLKCINRDDFVNIIGSIIRFITKDCLEGKFLETLSDQTKKYIADNSDISLGELIKPVLKGELQYGKFVENTVEFIINNYSGKVVDGITGIALPWLLDRKIAIFAAVLKGYGKTLGKSLSGILFSFIRPRVGEITEILNIPKLVSEKVIAYDVTEMETIILSVVDRELKTVILLGAFFGFIIGLAGPLISGLLT